MLVAAHIGTPLQQLRRQHTAWHGEAHELCRGRQPRQQLAGLQAAQQLEAQTRCVACLQGLRQTRAGELELRLGAGEVVAIGQPDRYPLTHDVTRLLARSQGLPRVIRVALRHTQIDVLDGHLADQCQPHIGEIGRARQCSSASGGLLLTDTAPQIHLPAGVETRFEGVSERRHRAGRSHLSPRARGVAVDRRVGTRASDLFEGSRLPQTLQRRLHARVGILRLLHKLSQQWVVQRSPPIRDNAH